MTLTTPSSQLTTLPADFLAERADSNKLLHVGIAFIVIATVVVILFGTARYLQKARESYALWFFVLLSWVCQIGVCIIPILVVKSGAAGRHTADILLNDPPLFEHYLKLQTAIEFVYCAAVTPPRIVILILYLKIFTSKVVRRLTWACIAVVFFHLLSSGIFVFFFICKPFSFIWDKSIDGHCADLLAAYRYPSVGNLVIDLAIMLLPVSTLYHLQMSKGRKVAISITFLLGSLGVIASIIRFVGYFTIPLFDDPTYLCVDAMILSIVEPGAYHICACLPYVRPLLSYVAKHPSLMSLHSSKNTKSKGQSDCDLVIPGMYHAKISAVDGHNSFQYEENCIRLEETVHVTSVSRDSARTDSMDAKQANEAHTHGMV